MRYMGGKAKIANEISAIIRARHLEVQSYYEPFVGAGWTLTKLAPYYSPVLATDVHPDLILMWQAIQEGWIPPVEISREEYAALRYAPPSPLRAFVGFGLSFGGKWFGGYATARGDDYIGAARRGVLRKAESMRGVEFRCADYRDWTPVLGTLVYADPPYGSTTAYSGTDKFDTAEFWSYMQKWASAGCHVYVSEYSAPDGTCDLVWSKIVSTSLKRDNNTNPMTENLFHVLS